MDRIGWKIYLIAIFLLASWTLLDELTESSQFDLISFADQIFLFSGFVGVFGYSFRRRLFQPKFWRTLLPIVVVWDIWLGLDSFKEFHSVLNQDEVWIAYMALVFALVLIVPTYVALYLYGYRSRNIWERSDT